MLHGGSYALVAGFWRSAFILLACVSISKKGVGPRRFCAMGRDGELTLSRVLEKENREKPSRSRGAEGVGMTMSFKEICVDVSACETLKKLNVYSANFCFGPLLVWLARWFLRYRIDHVVSTSKTMKAAPVKCLWASKNGA